MVSPFQGKTAVCLAATLVCPPVHADSAPASPKTDSGSVSPAYRAGLPGYPFRDESAEPAFPRRLPAVRAAVPPTVDGVLDDPIWQTAATSARFSDARRGGPVADDTRVWIAYDDRNIYVAIYAFDSEPERIVARENRRGVGFRNDDRVRFRFNPFNSKRGDDESELNVNPLGTQYAEIAGGRASKQEWEGVWQSAARIVEDGWIAEMAIPWEIFVRPASDGRPTTMGINFQRVQQRNDVRSYWSDLGPNERIERTGEWVGVILPPSRRANPLSVLPYVFGGLDEGRTIGRFGLDARYEFSPTLSGVATLEPDFSNIESAVTSIAFTYTERLPGERRPFFQEGSRFYAADLGGVRPFASQRIPDFDFGAKLYGKIGPTTNLGLLTAHRFGGRNDAVATLRHFFTPNDAVVAQFVQRLEHGVDNRVVGVETQTRRGDWFGEARYGRSDDLAGSGEFLSASVDWSSRQWSGGGKVGRVSQAFRPRNGFVPFRGESGADIRFGYGGNYLSGPVRELGAGVNAWYYDRTEGGLFRRGASASLSTRTWSDVRLSTSASFDRFLGNDDRRFSASVDFPSSDPFNNFGLSFSTGRIRGEDIRTIDASVNRRIFNRIQVGASTEIVRFVGESRQDIVTVTYDIDREQSVAGRLLNRGGETSAYLSYRKSGYGGTEWFVILGDPNDDGFRTRAVVKVIWKI
ncbi:MAG: carbohydrate binding family 9 domain-containing protein [Fimbriimonadaceae bacterium]